MMKINGDCVKAIFVRRAVSIPHIRSQISRGTDQVSGPFRPAVRSPLNGLIRIGLFNGPLYRIHDDQAAVCGPAYRINLC